MHTEKLMNANIKIVGAASFVKRMKEEPERLNRTIESLLKQEARALCVEYGRATLPGPGFDEGRDEQFRGRVERDVRRVFAVKSKPNTVMSMLKVLNPTLARAYWWGGVKKDNEKVKNSVLRKAGLPRGLNPADHKAARTGKKGRVGKLERPASLATENRLDAYVKKQRALVGFAKAGWYAAARSLGGRVRTRVDLPDGRRSSEEIFPAHVRKLGNKYRDAGGSTYNVVGMKHTVVIFTRVKHAQEALPLGLYHSATDIAKEKFTRALAHALQAMTRRKRTGKRDAA